MIDPRANFQAAPGVAKAWPDVVDAPLFQAAAVAALVQMEINIPLATNIESAAAAHYRMQGAKQFLGILMGLVDPETKQPVALNTNLNHKT